MWDKLQKIELQGKLIPMRSTVYWLLTEYRYAYLLCFFFNGNLMYAYAAVTYFDLLTASMSESVILFLWLELVL